MWYETFNLEGKTIAINLKDSLDGKTWNCWIPAVVLKEYPTWMLCEVLPHMNPEGFAMSKPYKIGLNKMNIQLGNIKIKELKDANLDFS